MTWPYGIRPAQVRPIHGYANAGVQTRKIAVQAQGQPTACQRVPQSQVRPAIAQPGPSELNPWRAISVRSTSGTEFLLDTPWTTQKHGFHGPGPELAM